MHVIFVGPSLLCDIFIQNPFELFYSVIVDWACGCREASDRELAARKRPACSPASAAVAPKEKKAKVAVAPPAVSPAPVTPPPKVARSNSSTRGAAAVGPAAALIAAMALP